jgi:hypothetical protein
MYYSLDMLGNRWYNPIMDKELKSHKITVDIPQDVWEAMRTLASEHQRSFVKELVWALQDYVRRERRKGALRDG